jgi:hypothetical protein
VRQQVSHSLIREAKHPISGRDKECLTFSVVVPLPAMHLAVELDDKMSFDTAEVKNERTKRMLSAELHPIQTPSAESCPKQVLSTRLASAQVASGGHVVAMTRYWSPWHGKSVARACGSVVPVVVAEDSDAG